MHAAETQIHAASTALYTCISYMCLRSIIRDAHHGDLLNLNLIPEIKVIRTTPYSFIPMMGL